MIEEIDIYRVAQIYINQYGSRALLEVMKRIEKFHLAGDEEGEIVWNKIADAIQWMEAPVDLVDTTCH
ncbi:MAG: hypothetical protein PHX61_06905 [Alphaproteobacteria bacterium]|nr:hypothetical protein [Alphaproteobacteria bacterium]